MFDMTPYFEQAKAFSDSVKGELILHISDTSTDKYPALKTLLQTVRPAVILHTGDAVDEFKVGRLEEHRAGYEAGFKDLMDILRSAECPLYFVSGNNDDLNLLQGETRATELPMHSELTLFGVRFLLDHYPVTDAGDVDFALTGHSGARDFHYPPQDREGEAIYLNGMFFWTLIDSATKQFLRLPCREAEPLNEWVEDGVRFRKKGASVFSDAGKKKWKLTQTHLHAGHENYASIRSHVVEAKRLGYNAIFITPHDYRMNRMPGCIEHFHLTSAGDALREDGKAGWYRAEDIPAESVPHGEGFALRLSEEESAFFFSQGKKHQAPLLAELTVSLTVELPEDSAVLFDFTLSQRPEDLEQQHLIYGLNATADTDWFLPVARQEDGVYTFPLSEDVLKFDPVFGLDNAFLTVTVTALRGEVRVTALDTARKYVAEDVRKRQKTLCNTIAREYKIKVLSGFEVSYGHHHNCFSAHVPVINYGETGYVKSERVSAAYLKSKDATYAYNHMFQEYRNVPEEEHEEAIQKVIAHGVATHFDGAQLLEVGFPAKKQGFTIEEHLRVWDAAALQGVRMVGYGDSDCHNSTMGWEHGNCFASWILSEHTYQEYLERAMRAGKVCLGNPAKWKSQWEYTVDGAEIGDTLKADHATASIRFWNLTEPSELRVIRAGELLCRYELDQAEFETALPLERGDYECCPVRLEVWTKEGKPRFFTNPIYLMK